MNRRPSVSDVRADHLPGEIKQMAQECWRIVSTALASPFATLYLICLTLIKVFMSPMRNFGQIYTFLKAKWEVMRLGQNHTAVNMFYNRLKLSPNKEALVFEGKVYTFKDMEECSNRVVSCLWLHLCWMFCV